jgi:hypothetical protein
MRWEKDDAEAAKAPAAIHHGNLRKVDWQTEKQAVWTPPGCLLAHILLRFGFFAGQGGGGDLKMETKHSPGRAVATARPRGPGAEKSFHDVAPDARRTTGCTTATWTNTRHEH